MGLCYFFFFFFFFPTTHSLITGIQKLRQDPLLRIFYSSCLALREMLRSRYLKKILLLTSWLVLSEDHWKLGRNCTLICNGSISLLTNMNSNSKRVYVHRPMMPIDDLYHRLLSCRNTISLCPAVGGCILSYVLRYQSLGLGLCTRLLTPA